MGSFHKQVTSFKIQVKITNHLSNSHVSAIQCGLCFVVSTDDRPRFDLLSIAATINDLKSEEDELFVINDIRKKAEADDL